MHQVNRKLDPLNLLRLVHYRNRRCAYERARKLGRAQHFPLPIQRVA